MPTYNPVVGKIAAGNNISLSINQAGLLVISYIGPTQTTPSAIAVYADTEGMLANSGVLIDASNNVSGINSLTGSVLTLTASGIPPTMLGSSTSGGGSISLSSPALLSSSINYVLPNIGIPGSILAINSVNGNTANLNWVSAAPSGVIAVQGTFGFITSSGGFAPAISIDPTYKGQSSIGLLGTITQGTWNANPISVAYGGTGLSAITHNALLAGNGVAALQSIETGIAGQALISGGENTLPDWKTLTESDIEGLTSDLAACEKMTNKGVAGGYCGLDSNNTISIANIPKIPESLVTNLLSDLASCEKTSNKGTANGYCGLDSSSLITLSNLPYIPESQILNLLSDLASCEKTANKGAANGYCGLGPTSLISVSNIPSLPESQIINLTTDLASCEKTTNKGTAGGYCSLDVNTLVPISNLPPLPESQITNLVTDLAAREKLTNKGSANGYCGLDSNSLISVTNIPLLSEAQITNLSSDLSACEKTANKGYAGGYCGLDSHSLVPLANLAPSVLSNVSITSPQNNQFLQYNSTNNTWQNQSVTIDTTLESLNDVAITSPTANQILSYNGTDWINSTLNLTTTLASLTDCSIVSPIANQLLQYNGVKWFNATLSLSTALSSLTDCTISSPAINQLLQYNGTKWVNNTNITLSGTITLANGSYGVTIQSPILSASSTYTLPAAIGTTGQVLTLSNSTGTLTWSTPSIGGTVTVVNGGTGVTSLAAYGLIAGGTISTGAVQTIANSSTAKQLLTTGTNSSLPSWVSASLSGGYISDVNISLPAPNQLLQYNGSNWVNADLTTIVEIQNCGDVKITSLTNNDVLIYNASSAKFINSQILSNLSTNVGVLSSTLKTFGNYPYGSGTAIANNSYLTVAPYHDNVDSNLVVSYTSTITNNSIAAFKSSSSSPTINGGYQLVCNFCGGGIPTIRFNLDLGTTQTISQVTVGIIYSPCTWWIYGTNSITEFNDTTTLTNLNTDQNLIQLCTGTSSGIFSSSNQSTQFRYIVVLYTQTTNYCGNFTFSSSTGGYTITNLVNSNTNPTTYGYIIDSDPTTGYPRIQNKTGSGLSGTYNDFTFMYNEMFRRIYPVIRDTNTLNLGSGAWVIANSSGTLQFNTNMMTLNSSGNLSLAGGLSLANNSYYITLQAPILSASSTYMLPATVGTTGQVLTLSNSTGTLTWSTPSAGGGTVATGGTGVTSLTAYGLIAGGTTSTGAVQTIANSSTAKQFLTTGTSSSLPSWVSASLSGGYISDVVMSSISNGDVLRYNSTTGQWGNSNTLSTDETNIQNLQVSTGMLITTNNVTQNTSIVTTYTDGTNGNIINNNSNNPYFYTPTTFVSSQTGSISGAAYTTSGWNAGNFSYARVNLQFPTSFQTSGIYITGGIQQTWTINLYGSNIASDLSSTSSSVSGTCTLLTSGTMSTLPFSLLTSNSNTYKYIIIIMSPSPMYYYVNFSIYTYRINGGYQSLTNGTDYTIATDSATGNPKITYLNSSVANLAVNMAGLTMSECYRRIYPVIRDTNTLNLGSGAWVIANSNGTLQYNTNTMTLDSYGNLSVTGTCSSNKVVKRVTIPTSSPYTITKSTNNYVMMKFILVNTSSTAYTITLPATPNQNTKIIVADLSNNAATKNITVSPSGSDTITNGTINTNGGITSYVYSGTQWTGTAITTLTIDTSDKVVLCDTSSGTYTLCLPSSPPTGMEVTFKDTGNATTNNVTINGNGNNIDGATTSVINTNYGKVTMVFDTNQWFVT